jgi:hypothetical protein
MNMIGHNDKFIQHQAGEFVRQFEPEIFNHLNGWLAVENYTAPMRANGYEIYALKGIIKPLKAQPLSWLFIIFVHHL